MLLILISCMFSICQLVIDWLVSRLMNLTVSIECPPPPLPFPSQFLVRLWLLLSKLPVHPFPMFPAAFYFTLSYMDTPVPDPLRSDIPSVGRDVLWIFFSDFIFFPRRRTSSTKLCLTRLAIYGLMRIFARLHWKKNVKKCIPDWKNPWPIPVILHECCL